MGNHNDGTRNLGHLGGNGKPVTGWTKIHSWMFLVIVTASLAIIGFQNRYHYFAPQGSGNTYRVDKLFGTLQQFDGDRGWVKADLIRDLSPEEPTRPRTAAPPLSESAVGTPGTPALPGTPPRLPRVDLDVPKRGIPSPEAPPVEPPGRVSVQAPPAPVVPTPSPRKEAGRAENLRVFKETFDDFGDEEFKLAHDDLYPAWKKNINPAGTWREFLGVYREFVQWWMDSGAPNEPGFKLWEKFIETKGH
ncbi:MAG: hypothetical protein AB1646_15600 [Thermodesulfobacteriota bacterium]